MKLDILNRSGASTGRSYEFSSEMLEEKPNEHAVYLAVKAYLANQRQGTHKAKERSEVAGSTRKLHKQKGTGGSRKGSIKSGVLHGGARIHGPRPRDYSQELNKKVKKVARRSVLIDKLLNNKVIIVEDFNFDTPKTKELLNIFSTLKADKKPLLVTGEPNKNIYLSGRNLPKTDVTFADELNVYDMLKADSVILFEGALDKIVQSIA